MEQKNAKNKKEDLAATGSTIQFYKHVIPYVYDVEKDRLTYTEYKKEGVKTDYILEHYIADVERSNILDAPEIIQYLNRILQSEERDEKGEFEVLANFNNEGYFRYRAYFSKKTDVNGKVILISGFLRSIDQENVQKIKKLTEIEEKDSATGFYHYEYGKKKTREFLASNPEAGTCGMLLIQIEEFEKMAMTEGAVTEGSVLRNIAEVIRHNFSSDSYLIRAGSTHFIVLDKAIHADGAILAAKQIVFEVMSLHMRQVGDLQLKITVGIAMNEKRNNFFHMYHHCKMAVKYAKCKKVPIAYLPMEVEEEEFLRIYESQELAEQDGVDERQARRNILSDLSYEIRTPLNAILGLTELVRAVTDDEKRVIQYLDCISSSTDQLIAVFNKVSPIPEDIILNRKIPCGEINFEGRRVLIAEDNLLNIEVERGMLEKKGVQVEVAKNGKIAVDMVKESAEDYYDLILMDIRMPVMDGNEATQKIRQLSRRDVKFIPIFAVSANAFYEDRKQAMESGMDAYITKPVDVEELYTLMAQHL